MPLYEYQCPAGTTVLEHRSVAERDKPVERHGVQFVRVRVPRRLMVCTGAKPETMSEKTWKGYRKLEEKGQLKDRPGYLPAAKVKEALLAPEAD